jgi:hypothetical protein
MVVVAALPGAAVSAVVAELVAAVKTAAPPLVSPMAAHVATMVVEPWCYSAPQLRRLLALGGRLPYEGSVIAAEPL